MPEAKLVKVQFYDPDVGYENLWATDLGNGRYRIESTPFFIYGISAQDVVTARRSRGGYLRFGKVAERSGNKALRARSDKFIKKAAYRNKVIANLEKLGCEVEQLHSRLLAINVPKNVDLQSVKDYLTNTAKVSWEYGNPENLNQ